MAEATKAATLLALEIDGRGELLPVVAYGGNLYSPRRRP